MTHDTVKQMTVSLVLLFQSSLLIAPLTAGLDENADEQQKKANDTSTDAVPGLRQPGDDVTPELTDPVRTADKAKKEALAAYMEGVAAQKNGKLQDALKAFTRAAKADPAAPEPVKAHALLLMRLGRVRQAEEMAQRAIKLDTDDYETRVQLAVLLLARRNVKEATRLIEDAVGSAKLKKNSPEFVSIHTLRGRLYYQRRDTAKAAQSYSILLDALEQPENYGLDFREHQKLMTDRATGYDSVGRVMLEVGRNDDAIRAFAALARVNEERPGDHHYWLALAQYRKDDLEASEKNLNRFFETNKRNAASLRLLSDLFRATSRSGEVVDRLRELADNTNDASVVNLFIGDLLVEKGDGDAAEEVYRNIIADTGDADAYLGLIRVDIVKRDAGRMLQNVRQALKAQIQIEELLPLRPLVANDTEFGRKVVDTCIESLKDKSVEHNPAATFFYSQLAASEFLDLPEKQGILLQATLDQNPGTALGIEAMGRLGLNQYMRDQYADAARTFRRLLSVPELSAGDRMMTLYRLSAAEAENENFDDAIKAIEVALKLEPQHPQLMYQLGLIQLQAERYEDSERTLKSTIRLVESDPQLEGQSRILLGALYSQTGRWDEAIHAYQELLNMSNVTASHVRRGQMALSNAYVQNGDMANGEKILEDVYAENPDDPGVNNDLGYLYAEQNKNLDRAEKMVRIAVEAEPENPAYLDSLGWVLHRLGRHEEALVPLRKATSDPDYRDSTIIEHLGDVQKALKQMDDAKKSWQEALDVEQKSISPNEDTVERLTKKIREESPADKASP